jgi:hypothetical protein
MINSAAIAVGNCSVVVSSEKHTIRKVGTHESHACLLHVYCASHYLLLQHNSQQLLLHDLLVK